MPSFDLLIIGGSGFVGSKLVETAWKAGRSVAYTYSRNQIAVPVPAFQLQVQDRQALETCISKTQPRCIVYCAVPPPKSDDYLHEVVSVQAVERVCAALRNLETCKLIYVSTNAVFSGQAGPYKESDLPDPGKRHDQYRSYALTRAQGEQVALNAWQNSIVARTSDVNGKDLLGKLNPRIATLLAQLKAGHPVERSRNAFISPTLVDHLAKCLLEISGQNFTDRGIFHLAGRQQISYFDFGRLIARKVGADEALIEAEVSHVWNISLDTGYTQSLLRTAFPTVEEQLSAIFS